MQKLALLAELDRGVLGRTGGADAIESAIANYELAYPHADGGART